MRHNVFPIRPFRALSVGDPAPFFAAATDGIEQYSLDVAAGRWIVLMMFGTLSEPASKQALDLVLARRRIFNDTDAAFYGVTVDPVDRSHRGLANSNPGVRYFWDFDCAVSRLYGVADGQHLKPTIFLLDPAFRIAMAEPVENAAQVLDRLAQELADAPSLADSPFAPVLILPRILEPELCAELIGYYRQGRPSPSGFAHDIDGRTHEAIDTRLKRRHDVTIERAGLVDAVRARLEAEQPDHLAHGVHLIVVQGAGGDLIVGDSHHYGPTPDPFASEAVDRLILDEFAAVFGREAPPVRERWTGTYASASDRMVLIDSPAEGVRLVTVTTGAGASTGFAIGEEVVGDLFGQRIGA